MPKSDRRMQAGRRTSGTAVTLRHRQRDSVAKVRTSWLRPSRLMAALAVASLSIPLVAFIALGATQAPATASGIPSSQGTDFWVGFESNYEGGNNLFLF